MATAQALVGSNLGGSPVSVAMPLVTEKDTQPAEASSLRGEFGRQLAGLALSRAFLSL